MEFRGGTDPSVGPAVTTANAGLLYGGVAVSSLLLADASAQTTGAVLGFGAAALSYLFAEELLVEWIQAEESLFSTTTLFLGFLAILAFDLFKH